MFSGRIRAEARAAGRALRVVRDGAGLEGVDGSLLLVDLNQAGALEAAMAWRDGREERKVIGFVSHVDTAMIASAREAGVDRVMARSQFVAELAGLLTGAR